MWWLWVLFASAAILQTAFVYWLHLPDDLLSTDPEGLVMAAMVGFLGFLIGCPSVVVVKRRGHFATDKLVPRRHDSKQRDWMRIIGAALLLGFVLGSAVMSFEWCREEYFKFIYYSIVILISSITIIICTLSEHIPNAIIMALAVAPFSLLFCGSVLTSPYLDGAVALFAFATLYAYLVHHRNVDLPSSICSAYLLSCFLVYGLLANPESLSKEFKAPFFRVIGANDTVLKYTVAGLLLIVWLFRSLVSEQVSEVRTNNSV